MFHAVLLPSSNWLASDMLRRGSACRCDDILCLLVKNSFCDVIMNERLKLKTVNRDTVWGGVSSGKGLSRMPKTGKI